MGKRQPVRDKVYLLIRKGIVQGKYLPGSHITEEQLATDFGTSRTPVREALRRLETEKMVQYHPYKGVVVSIISEDELENLYEIRAFLEGIVAKRAALRSTPKDIRYLNELLNKIEDMNEVEEISKHLDKFSNALVKIANCPQICEIKKQVREILNRTIVATFVEPERSGTAQKEHREIVAAIEKKDADLAQKLTVTHIQNAATVAKIVQRS